MFADENTCLSFLLADDLVESWQILILQKKKNVIQIKQIATYHDVGANWSL